MDKDLLTALIGTASVFALSFPAAYMARRGQIAGEKPIATHWSEFLTGRWPLRLQWLGSTILVVLTVWFIWDLASQPGPALKSDVLRGFVLGIAWAIEIAGRATLIALNAVGQVTEVLRRTIDVTARLLPNPDGGEHA